MKKLTINKRMLNGYTSTYVYLTQCRKFTVNERLNIIEKIDKGVELRKANISKKEMVKKIESQNRLIKNPNITDLLTLDDEILLVKGTFYFSFLEGESGCEYPFFGMLLQNEGIFLTEDFHELLQVLLIDGTYYLVTYWQRPESGGRGLKIYKLEKRILIKVFADHSDAT